MSEDHTVSTDPGFTPPHALIRVLSAGFTVALFAVACSLGGRLVHFVDIPSLLIVGGGTAGLVIAIHGPRGLRELVSTVVTGGSSTQVARSRAVLLHAGTLFIGTGVVGTLIGLVQMMNNIDDPAAIGPAMAVALLTALYGIVGALGCFVVGGMVHGRETRPSTASDPDGVSAAITSIGTAILLMPALVCFAALLAVFQ